jgi:hypothetical protein
MSHVDDFGRFLAYFVSFLFPTLGFGSYVLIFQQRVNWQWWKPLAIAVAFATPLHEAIRQPLLSLGLNEPLAETVRAVVVFTLMVGSIRAIPIHTTTFHA